MFKQCLLIFVFNLFIIQNLAEQHGHPRVRKNVELENTLRRMRTLLREPIDEEHDEIKEESDDTHANEWTVQISSDNYNLAREIASKYGFGYVSQVEGVGTGVFRFSRDFNINKKNTEKVNEEVVLEANKELHEAIDKTRQEEEEVVSKRDHIEALKRLAADENVKWYKRERILSREKRDPSMQSEDDKGYSDLPNDPKFKREWYIQNTGQTSGPAKFDSKVLPVWKMGYTGKGVVLSVLDDGMDHTHPELQDNYDPKASKDLNSHDDDPFPNDSDPYNAHGTKCAGTIAAKANNSLCGVGIAYGAGIGAIRMLDGKATDGLEADALSFHRNHTDIYSCSWGPKDNGKTFGRPGKLGRMALAQGTKFGRNGKGSLFIWATGNGGMMNDDCNADGYVNSIYTLGVGSVNEHGVSTYYGEHCPSMFAVTYCSGQHKSGFGRTDAHANVITTYLHHQCTNHFVGTSSAAPLAAAIFALVLEAKPSLTWRDVQHLVYHTAVKISPLDLGWKTNGCGKPINHKFGFGVLDAHQLVMAALNWTTVPKQRSCHFRLNFKNGDLPSKHHFKLSFTTDGCQSCKKKMSDGKCKNRITKLEHVVVSVTLKHRRRGDLSIDLISPAGTISRLLHVRPYDESTAGLKGWTFMTLFNWCENPKGTWQLIFKDNEGSHLFEKKSRDMEEEYIQQLDKKKAKQREIQSGDQSDDASVAVKEEKQHYDAEQAYKREFDQRNPYRQQYGYNKREEYNPYERDQRSLNNLYKRYHDYRRVGRAAEDENEDKTDYVLYKKTYTDGEYQHKFQDEVLGRSILAGEVTDLSVTLYGTA